MAELTTAILRFVSIFAIMLAGAGVANAQTAESTEPESHRDGPDEIVVAAQELSENLQTEPIAVTALSADSLETRGVQSILDLNFVVPGLSCTTVGSVASPRIRGVGTGITQCGNENAGATYGDGVYYASLPASVLSSNSIQQIAVLKGPQGTLFASKRNFYLTRDP